MLYPTAPIKQMENQGIHSAVETVKPINFRLGVSPRKEIGKPYKAKKVKAAVRIERFELTAGIRSTVALPSLTRASRNFLILYFWVCDVADWFLSQIYSTIYICGVLRHQFAVVALWKVIHIQGLPDVK